jgi:F-type H+-transporting ATPase subunit gamma
LKPDSFLFELTDHYLFSALHRVLFDSLITENEFRARHLENAVSHLDNKTSELLRKSNALRQEEIIEEIEVILLNSSII